jgi:hypothetical protein
MERHTGVLVDWESERREGVEAPQTASPRSIRDKTLCNVGHGGGLSRIGTPHILGRATVYCSGTSTLAVD